jgi:small-conductance mechanosensitive channel
MKVPAPIVYFMDFGASSLDFELRAHIIQVDTGMTVRSELRFAILKALREAGVEIPFPQQDLHLRDLEKLEKLLASARDGKARSATKPPRPRAASTRENGGKAQAARKRRRTADDLENADATGDDSE